MVHPQQERLLVSAWSAQHVHVFLRPANLVSDHDVQLFLAFCYLLCLETCVPWMYQNDKVHACSTITLDMAVCYDGMFDSELDFAYTIYKIIARSACFRKISHNVQVHVKGVMASPLARLHPAKWTAATVVDKISRKNDTTDDCIRTMINEGTVHVVFEEPLLLPYVDGRTA